MCRADAATAAGPVSDELRRESLARLEEVLANQDRWVKVHAAEALIDAGETAIVEEAFTRELAAHGTEPEYRIGIRRVLIKTIRVRKSNDVYAEWLKPIRSSFVDRESSDRVHAAETLAKLQVKLDPQELSAAKAGASGNDARLGAYCRWLLVVGDPPERVAHVKSLLKLLESPPDDSRSIAAYALRYLGKQSLAEWQQINKAGQTEKNPFIKLRLAGAALATGPQETPREALDAIHDTSQRATLDGGPKFQIEWASILAETGDARDIETLIEFLRTESRPAATPSDSALTADLQATAANAILRIDRRNQLDNH